MRSRGWWLIVVGAILVMPVGVYGQEATLSGTITDSTGGVLPGVSVRAVHEATGNTFETVTDERGGYRIAVRIGVYAITADLTGFATVTRSGLEVLVGQRAVVDLQMAPSTVQESVTVTDSCTDDGDIWRSTTTRCPTSTSSPLRVTEAKPVRSAVTA